MLNPLYACIFLLFECRCLCYAIPISFGYVLWYYPIAAGAPAVVVLMGNDIPWVVHPDMGFVNGVIDNLHCIESWCRPVSMVESWPFSMCMSDAAVYPAT